MSSQNIYNFKKKDKDYFKNFLEYKNYLEKELENNNGKIVLTFKERRTIQI